MARVMAAQEAGAAQDKAIRAIQDKANQWGQDISAADLRATVAIREKGVAEAAKADAEKKLLDVSVKEQSLASQLAGAKAKLAAAEKSVAEVTADRHKIIQERDAAVDKHHAAIQERDAQAKRAADKEEQWRVDAAEPEPEPSPGRFRSMFVTSSAPRPVKLVAVPPGNDWFATATSQLQNTWSKKDAYEFIKTTDVWHVENEPLLDRYETCAIARIVANY